MRAVTRPAFGRGSAKPFSMTSTISSNTLTIGTRRNPVIVTLSTSTDLTTMSGMYAGQEAKLKVATGITVPVKDTDNINGSAVANVIMTLNHVDDVLTGHFDGTNFIVEGRFSNGS